MISKPSKSAKKRNFLALQALGEQLINLSGEQLNSIGLDERLHKAVVDAKSMRARGALKRQKQLIGKLMRTVDPVPIRAALDCSSRQERRGKIIFKQAEYWRDRILVEDTQALEAFFAHIGHKNDLLAKTVSSCPNDMKDLDKTKARRSIFREVYNEIYIKVQKDTSTV